MNASYGRNLRLAISLCATAALLVSCCCCPKKDGRRAAAPEKRVLALRYPNPLPVVPRQQEGYYSCWATCAEMIMEYVGAMRHRQCEQAVQQMVASTTVTSSCCSQAGDLLPGFPCDRPSLPSFLTWGFDSLHQYQQPLNWQQATGEIDGGRPFAFSLIGSGTAAAPGVRLSHMIVAVGYSESGGVPKLQCFNPRFGGLTDFVVIPFTDYVGEEAATAVGAGNGYLHEHDYFMVHHF